MVEDPLVTPILICLYGIIVTIATFTKHEPLKTKLLLISHWIFGTIAFFVVIGFVIYISEKVLEWHMKRRRMHIKKEKPIKSMEIKKINRKNIKGVCRLNFSDDTYVNVMLYYSSIFEDQVIKLPPGMRNKWKKILWAYEGDIKALFEKNGMNVYMCPFR